MKKGRFLVILLAVLALALGGAVYYFLQNLDRLVAEAIETHGSAAAGTPVRVDGVEILLKAGSGTVRGLTVVNPSDFPGELILSLGEITLDLDTGSLAGGVPVVEEIRIGAPSFYVAVNRKGQTNVGILKKNLQKFSPADQRQETTPEGAPLRLKVRRLVVEGAKGTLDLTALGEAKREIVIPPVTLTDLGGARGATPAELAKEILAALARNLERAAKRAGLEKVKGELEKKVEEKLGEGAGEALKGILGK